jgi:hypothetical protein
MTADMTPKQFSKGCGIGAVRVGRDNEVLQRAANHHAWCGRQRLDHGGCESASAGVRQFRQDAASGRLEARAPILQRR